MSGEVVIKAKHGESGEDVILNLDFGETLEASIEDLSADVVHSLFIIGAKTQARNKLRNAITGEAPMSAEAALSMMAEYKPTIAGARTPKDPVQAAMAAYAGFSIDEKAAFIKLLQNQAAARPIEDLFDTEPAEPTE